MNNTAEAVSYCPCSQCRALNLFREVGRIRGAFTIHGTLVSSLAPATPDWRPRPTSLHAVVMHDEITFFHHAPHRGRTQPEQETEMYVIKSTKCDTYYRPGVWSSLSDAYRFPDAPAAFRVLADVLETNVLSGTPDTYRVVRVKQIVQPGARRVFATPEGGLTNGWAIGFQKDEGKSWWVTDIETSTKGFGWMADLQQAKVFTGANALKEIARALREQQKAFPFADSDGYDIVRVWAETTPATAQWVEA